MALALAALAARPTALDGERAMQPRVGLSTDNFMRWMPPSNDTRLSARHRAAWAKKRVLVLGGMMNQRDLDLAATWAADEIIIYNNWAGQENDCDGDSDPGAWCGSSCLHLQLPSHAQCKIEPNMGRSESAFFRYVVDNYADLADEQVVFSGSTVSTENRSVAVPFLLDLAKDGDDMPRCNNEDGGKLYRPEDPGGGYAWNFSFSQHCSDGTDPDDVWTGCHWCASPLESMEVWNGTRLNPGETPCEISYVDYGKRRTQTVCAAVPNVLSAWLEEYAPSPHTHTISPSCYRGVFRSSGEAIRRRPREEYLAILEQLLKCSNPEAAHFVERAALYIFASL